MGQRQSARNVCLHGVSFELFNTEAPVLEVYDVDHSVTEDRFKSIGPIRRGLVLVVWTERTDNIVRIISAWWATKTEEQMYAEHLEDLA
jgi:uncharacterized DUF497 family protein